MLLLDLARKNLWRNRHRTLIAMASIAFAVVLSVFTSSLKTGVFDNLIKNMVSSYTGYIQIHQKGYWDERILDNSFAHLPELEKKLLFLPDITAISPRLESFALASTGDKTKGCMVAGVDPEKEDQITSLKSKITKGSCIGKKRGEIMLAEGLMKRLTVQLNDTLVLIGQGYHGATAAGKYRIAAQLHFGSPELNDNALFLSLTDAQEMYAAENQLTSFAVSIRNPDNIKSIQTSLQQQLGNAYEVMTWKEIMPDIEQHIRGDSANMQIVQLVLYLLICFGIFSTLLVMMEERKFELGMLVAIGMRKQKLAFVLLLESLLTVLAGCTIGMLIAIPLVTYFNLYPIHITGETAKAYQRFGFEPIFPASLHPRHFIEQGVIVLCIGLLLSLYPVYKIFTLDTIQAMRK